MEKGTETFKPILANLERRLLRERTTFKLKERRVLSHHEANIGDIVLIKDDLPRGMWKIRKIIELTVSSDGKVRSAKIMLPTNKTLNRTLNFLYPLECRDSDECNVVELN